jgi:hypothetical protein
MRPLHLLCALLAQGLALSPAVAAENEDARSGLERLELALAQAVDRVSRPAAAPLLAAGSCRGYRIRGVGAVFVLPPRALRQGGSVFVFHPGEAPPAPEGTPSAETPRPRRASRGKARVADPREEQMRLIEAQVEAFQREAERSRQEAEAALDQLEYQVGACPARRRPRRAATERPARGPGSCTAVPGHARNTRRSCGRPIAAAAGALEVLV